MMAKAGRRARAKRVNSVGSAPTETSSDDEGVEHDVEGVAAIAPASLKGLDDDTVRCRTRIGSSLGRAPTS